MPFPEKLRDWWMRATGNGNAADAQCQWRYFDPDGELKQCTYQGEQVHHPIAESYLLYALAQNPNEIEGLVVCLFHHILGQGDILEPDGSFHPDMGQARKMYHQLKAQGRDSFREAGQRHHDLAVKGERFWQGTDETDQYYRDIAKQIAHDYSVTHPDDPMPVIKKHPKLMEPKKWYSIFFDNS